MKKISLICTIWFVTLCVGTVFADLNDGLVAHYPFKGGANDESGNENNGIVHNAILSEDRFGNEDSAYYFDGIDDYIKIAHSDSLNLTVYTVAIWCKTDSTTSPVAVVAKGESGDTDKMEYSLFIKDKKAFSWYELSDDTDIEITSENSIVVENWFFLTVVRDENDEYKIYIDGSLEKNKSDTKSPAKTSSPIYLGVRTNKDSIFQDYFKGKLDDLYIYNRALTDSEVQQLFQNENHTSCAIFDLDNDGVPNEWDECNDTPQGSWVNSNGCRGELLYTEDDMKNMVNNILKWDANKDKQIGLIEAVQILRDASGVINSQQK